MRRVQGVPMRPSMREVHVCVEGTMRPKSLICSTIFGS